MTTPGHPPQGGDTASTYAEEAAVEFRKAREANDQRLRILPSLEEAKVPTLAMRAEISARSMEIAEGFTRLAAIEAGLPPCYHALRPEPGQEPS